MKVAILCVLVLAGRLAGQVGNETETAKKTLISSLMALKDAGPGTAHQQADKLTDGIMAGADAAHRPSRATIAALARELTETLSGRDQSNAAVSQLATDIIAVLQSAGMGTSEFKRLISRVENTLSSLGVSATTAQKVAARLTSVGNNVRGPQDMPLLLPR